MSDIDPRMNGNAVSIYENEPSDDFPVLKAFQQYIDAEQAKSRKRVMMLCVFFSFILTAVISVFVVLLIGSSARTQALNDRLVEYAMKDRERAQAPVVVQSPQDNSAIMSLANKLEDMKKEIAESRARAEQATAELTQKTAMTKGPTKEELEIQRLKALLTQEKEKAAAEREKQRQIELEAYRRTHYPELYGLKRKSTSSRRSRQALIEDEDEADREIESILNDDDAIDYFNDADDDGDEEPVRPRAKKSRAKSEKEETASAEDGFKIPVDVKNASGSSWAIPLD